MTPVQTCLSAAIWSAFFIVSSAAPATAQSAVSVEHELPANALNELRQHTVSLPGGYHASDDRHPVIIVLDGGSHAAHMREAAEIRYQTGLPNPIIVGVRNVDRARDFTFEASDEAPNGGGSAAFMTYLVEELLPSITAEYRTSGHVSLFGHSAAGLLGVEILIEYPEAFDAMILVSPTVRWGNFALLERLPAALAARADPVRLHLSWGNETGLEAEGFARLVPVLESRPDRVRLTLEPHTSEGHTAIPYIAAFEGLRRIYAPFDVRAADFDDQPLASVQAHFEALAVEYGLPGRPPQRLLLDRGGRQRSAGAYQDAAATFTYFADSYPGNPMPLVQLGRTYEEAGQLADALETYRRSAAIMIWPPDLPDRIARLEAELAD